MAAVQVEDVRASFLYVGDLNGHHQEWLRSTTTNRHGVATFDFATVSGCDQLVVGPTHEHGGTLVVWVAVVELIGNSDHSPLSAVIAMAQAVPYLCVSMKIFLKHQVNLNTVCGAIRELSCITFGLLTNLLRLWTNICPCWLDVMYQPRSSVWERERKPWFDDQCRHAFGLKQEALWSNFVGPVIALGLKLRRVCPQSSES